MNDKLESPDPPISSFDLAPGLVDYYSSQAELLLAQYQNINRLLGDTTHGTPSGDLCENLLKEFLRRFLPSTLSVDKGYFYGRSQLDGKDRHGPEIDILVHDTHKFLPLARTGDFVIVRPQAVRAMIQVKRKFKVKTIQEGLQNVIHAKQQLANVLWTGDTKNGLGWDGNFHPPRVFTGIVGFEGQAGRNLMFYRKTMLDWHMKHRSYDRAKMIETSMYVLPSFIGSLQSFFLIWDGPCNFINQLYEAFDSEHAAERSISQEGGKISKQRRPTKNVCLQALLAKMYNVIGGNVSEMPPFAFPPDLRFFDAFSVLQFEVILDCEKGTAILRRNDGWKAIYRREEWQHKDHFHIICDSKGTVRQTALLRTDITPLELIIKRDLPDGIVCERYIRQEICPGP